MAKRVKIHRANLVSQARISKIASKVVNTNTSVTSKNASITPTDLITQALSIKRISTNEVELGIIRWLGGTRLPEASNLTGFDIIKLSYSGITKASVDKLAGHIGISRKSLAEDILAVSVKTIERKGATEKLDKRTSSHAVEIARVLQHAYEVFEDEEKVKRWINKENRALNNQRPVQLFDTLTGLNMVSDILGRIEEGVYS